MPGTVNLHRVIAASPDKVFRAFTDAAALAQWLPPYGFTCTVDTLDAKKGGKHHASFTNFSTGNSHSFGGEYLEYEPGKRLKYSDKFDDANLPGEMIVMIDLEAVPMGTELRVEQSGIPDMIPTSACYLGWQESLDKLVKLVTPEIPDN